MLQEKCRRESHGFEEAVYSVDIQGEQNSSLVLNVKNGRCRPQQNKAQFLEIQNKASSLARNLKKTT